MLALQKTCTVAYTLGPTQYLQIVCVEQLGISCACAARHGRGGAFDLAGYFRPFTLNQCTNGLLVNINQSLEVSFQVSASGEASRRLAAS